MERRPATPEEARALAHPLRLRILRLCLNDALSNKQLASRLGKDPATVLHHVRTLERAGFLAAEADRRGRRGARERPYRATGKSWTLDVGTDDSQMLATLDAFRAELLESPGPVAWTRFAVRLRPDDRDELLRRIEELGDEFVARDDPAGEPLAFFIAGHRWPPPEG